MKSAIIILLFLTATFGSRGEERVADAEQIANPILRWLYLSELPPGTVIRDDDKAFWSATGKDRILSSPNQTAWVSVTIYGVTHKFTYDIGQRHLQPTDLTEAEFLRANSIRDGGKELQQFLTVHVRVAPEANGLEASFDTGGMCHGRNGSISFHRAGQVITLIKAKRRGTKCCF